jgi:uncharacterized protein YjdB
MKKAYLSSVLVAATILFGAVKADAQAISYQAYVQSAGWQNMVNDGILAGTIGQDKRLEAIKIWNPSVGGQVCYQAYVQDIGWQGLQCNGGLAGTTGAAKRMQALTIWYNNAPFGSSLQFRGHMANTGWEPIKNSGSTIGTANGAVVRIEGVELNVWHGQQLYWQ